ncbi:MAG TPA: ion channel [Bacteroidia bacterium]|nr:ion channel [Bacteroidia bacterium]
MSEKNSQKRSAPNDLGFGTTAAGARNMNKDGSFNVHRTGEPRFRNYEIYHRLITMSWTKFIFLIFFTYTVVNFLFAGLYYLMGPEKLSMDTSHMHEGEKFLEVFFFSSQTLTTLGYGRIAPVGALASVVSALEAMIGLLGFALATGLLYGRFSRPQSRLLYSENAVVAPYRDGIALMFRLTNMRRNQLIEVEIDVNIGYYNTGSKTRSFDRLTLERNKINLFPTSWTIVHPIDETSPLYGKTAKDLEDMKLEAFILLKAFDDTFSQTVYSRTSYHANEVVFGAKFLPMFYQQENGKTVLNLELINAMEKVKLPGHAVKEIRYNQGD